MDASSVPQERVPWTVRVNTYIAPHRVPEEWREWAAREIRSPGWAWKSLAVTSVPAVLFLLTFAFDGLSVFEGLLVLAASGVVSAVGRSTRNFRRRQALGMLRAKRDVRLRPWDLPLALGIGAAAVALLLLYGP